MDTPQEPKWIWIINSWVRVLPTAEPKILKSRKKYVAASLNWYTVRVRGLQGKNYSKIPNHPKSGKTRIGVIYGSIGQFDAWNVFVCILEYFKINRLKFEIVICFTYIGDVYKCTSILESLQAPHGLAHPAGTFFQQKNTPGFWEPVSCGFCQGSSI